MTLHGPHVFVEIWTAMRPSLPPVTRSHSALLLANFTFPSPPSAADAALIRNRRRFCLLFFYEERRKKRARERSRKTPAIRSFFYATSTCTNARASNPNEGMLSHIPSKVHTKDDNIMNVPELFSTISRLKAFARPLHARTENRTLVRITAVLSKNTVVVRQKRRRLYKRKRVVQKDVVVFLPREIKVVDDLPLTFFSSKFVRPTVQKKRSNSMSLLLCASRA